MTDAVTLKELRSWARSARTVAAKLYATGILVEHTRTVLASRIEMLLDLAYDDFIIIGYRNELNFLCTRATQEGQ